MKFFFFVSMPLDLGNEFSFLLIFNQKILSTHLPFVRCLSVDALHLKWNELKFLTKWSEQWKWASIKISQVRNRSKCVLFASNYIPMYVHLVVLVFLWLFVFTVCDCGEKKYMWRHINGCQRCDCAGEWQWRWWIGCFAVGSRAFF